MPYFISRDSDVKSVLQLEAQIHNCSLAVILCIKNNLLLLLFSLQDIPNTNSVITKM